ncbi:Uncharacterised protein [Mycobacteroides abscessus subsp. abscessus]|nr:hypothetical protein E3G66_003720 [Mycobacteroides abscessus]SHP05902.1 Uncharacterised protein [Mycobacteroides abscessus subsp. abscessus]SKR95322.1 Uncharacterised protein [Mycobacteroides abscessus subsp. massiliense]SHP20553.1 Uncharacterised protein [Mycobacteroides abscessus subsp. abscessus]SHP91456.1 Uncharacterised protein [Mycobacteroides abscessus subsp. abscessus]
MMAEEDESEALWVGFPSPGGPSGLHRVGSIEELSRFPDGTAVIWTASHCVTDQERQAGVLVTDADGTRETQPVSVVMYEDNIPLNLADPPVWVLTFDDPDATVD